MFIINVESLHITHTHTHAQYCVKGTCKEIKEKYYIHPSIFYTFCPGEGGGGSILSRADQTSLSPATDSTSS